MTLTWAVLVFSVIGVGVVGIVGAKGISARLRGVATDSMPGIETVGAVQAAATRDQAHDVSGGTPRARRIQEETTGTALRS